MNSLSKNVEPIVEDLIQNDIDQLYEKLGMRAKAMTIEPSAAGQFDPPISPEIKTMGFKEDFKKFGLRLFRRWNREVHDLICGNNEDDAEDRANLLSLLGKDVAFASVLTGVMVSSFGLAPAIATVLAALVVKRFLRPGIEEFCEVWEESLDE